MLKIWTMREFLARVFLPIIAIEFFLLPFWFFSGAASEWVSPLQIILTGLVLPTYLALIGSRFIWCGTVWHALLALVIPIPAILLALLLDYFAWGIWSGMFWDPDNKTVMLLRVIGQIAFGIAMIPLVLTTINRYARPNPHRSP